MSWKAEPEPAPAEAEPSARPAVTLTYAQSLDGSIATHDRSPIRLSGDESMLMTHRLRAEHDAILIGVGTVLSDNPSLTVRLVEGRNPTPIVLDSTLRCPPTAKIVVNACTNDVVPIIVCGERAAEHDQAAMSRRRQALESAGVRVVVLALVDGRIDLHAMLEALGSSSFNIGSIMVEGGARVISSFLFAGVVTKLVVTIAPTFAAGLCPTNETRHHKEVSGLSEVKPQLPELMDVSYTVLGRDVVMTATPVIGSSSHL